MTETWQQKYFLSFTDFQSNNDFHKFFCMK